MPRFAGGVCEGIVLLWGEVRERRTKGSALALGAVPPRPRSAREPAPAFPWRARSQHSRGGPTPKPTRGGKQGAGDAFLPPTPPLEEWELSFLGSWGRKLRRPEGQSQASVTLLVRVRARMELKVLACLCLGPGLVLPGAVGFESSAPGLGLPQF